MTLEELKARNDVLEQVIRDLETAKDIYRSWIKSNDQEMLEILESMRKENP